jgi:hypothetical protein
MLLTTYFTSATELLAKAIIENEELDLEVRDFENALGDTMLEVKGSKEDVRTFIQIFRMVGGN